ncbi:MAG: hypothetical protein KDI39_09375 [Pseudomonadales bacterium]|nr:hypothetical protein [Pseudomonadales bacterium]
MNTQTLHPKAQALLDAQVAYILQRLTGEELANTLTQNIDAILANASLITLNESVTPQMIKETVYHYAIKLDLGAGVFDIIGDIARTLHSHQIHQQTTLNDIVPDKHVEQILDKVLELKTVRDYIVQQVIMNPVYAALASDVMYYGLRDYLLSQLGGQQSRQRFASLVSWGKNLVERVPPDVEQMIELNLRHYIQKSLSNVLNESQSFLAHIDLQKLRDNLLDIWDDLKQHPISTYKQLLSSVDVEELFVLSYEFWRDFRQSSYFKVLIDSGIDAFFNRYGEATLSELLDEMGISREMLISDAVRFAPPVLAMLQQKSLLEPFIRLYLEPFYCSAQVWAILEA